MPGWLELLLATLMFATGLRLSAFFSGSETGFYRLSIPRLSIDARTGDRKAKRLLWFSQNPAYFVATCLVGNNVSNYVTTFAISWWTILLFHETSEALEVTATLLMSPFIFQFAELLPKTVYYHTPLSRLRANISWFSSFYWVFIPLTWPLVQITRLFETFSKQSHQPSEIVLGRNRLTQLMQHGHEEGVLTNIQSRLANGLLQLAPQSIAASMIPEHRVLGVDENTAPREVVEFARKYGVSTVAIHAHGRPLEWTGYVLATEVLLDTEGKLHIYPMPEVSHRDSKLHALYVLQREDATHGVVKRDGKVLGVIARNGLIEQIFRPESVTKTALSVRPVTT